MRLRIKRRIALLATLLCVCMGAALAETLSFRTGQELPQDVRFSSVVLQGDALFAYDQSGQVLHQIDAGSGSHAEFRPWSDAAGASVWHEAFLCSGDALRAIEVDYEARGGEMRYKGARLVSWSGSGAEIVRGDAVDLDLSDFAKDSGFQDVMPDPIKIVQMDGGFCLFLRREGMPFGELYSLSPSGALDRLPVEDPSDIVCAQGAQILFLSRQDEETLVQTFDLDAGRTETLLRIPAYVFAACYDRDSKAFYYVADSIYRLSTHDPAQAEVIAGKPFAQCSGLFFGGDRLLCFGEQQLALLSPGAPGSAQALIVAGSIGDGIYDGFCSENPSILLHETDLLPESTILSNMLTRNSDVDVYLLLPAENQSFIPLRDRGFCPALTDPAARAFAEALYPDLAAHLLDADGQLCALPTDFVTRITLGVDVRLWNELQLGPIPETWDQFFDFLENEWAAYSRNNVDVRLFPYSTAEETRSAIFYALKADYEAYRLRRAPADAYSTPLYQNLLKRLLRIDFDGFQYSQSDSAPMLLTDWYEARPSTICQNVHVRYLPLSIDGVEHTKIAYHPGLAFINPYSQNLEAAQRFMGYLAEHMSGEVKVALLKDARTPVKSEIYDRICQDYLLEAEALNAQLEGADAERQAELREMIAENERNFEENIRGGGYRVSPEAVSAYKELVASTGLTFLFDSTTASDAFSQMVEFGSQLLQGRIDVEKYTAELDRILLYSEREGQ